MARLSHSERCCLVDVLEIGSKLFDNTIADNSVRGNQPVDLAYDKSGSGNRFVSNECRTSTPVGLCDDD